MFCSRELSQLQEIYSMDYNEAIDSLNQST